MLRIDGVQIQPALIDGTSNNAFQGSTFLLAKPRWIPDEDAIHCAICRNKFNQLRRRHHCRCCGKVLCNKCCTEKVPLPQYGFDIPERVCSACVPVASCVTMSYSSDPAFNLRSATGLSALCRDSPSSVVALGGAHALISMTKRKSSDQLQTVSHIANGLHSLSRHECLTYWLNDLGALAAISHMLNLGADSAHQINLTMITDLLSSLRILVKNSEKLKVGALKVGCFPILLKLCNHKNSSISLVATTTLCLLAECPQNHNVFISNQDALRSLLLKVTESIDEQVKEHVLRILVILSTGSDEVKHAITSEDAACGGVLAHALRSKPKNLQILASAAASIANLATSERDQVLLQSSLRAVFTELPSNHPEYVTIQLIRAAANFASHSAHCNTVLSHLNGVICLLSSKGSKINFHAVRCIFYLLRFRSAETIDLLSRNGVADFLLRFSEMSDVMDEVIKSLNAAAPPVSA